MRSSTSRRIARQNIVSVSTSITRAGVRAGPLRGELAATRPTCGTRRRDLGLVADPVRDRAARGRRRGRASGADQPRQPAGRRRACRCSAARARRRSRSRAPGCRRARSRALRSLSTTRTCGLQAPPARAGSRACRRTERVVHDDQLVVRVLGAREHALEAHARERQVVVARHHDARRRGAGPRHHAPRRHRAAQRRAPASRPAAASGAARRA